LGQVVLWHEDVGEPLHREIYEAIRGRPLFIFLNGFIVYRRAILLWEVHPHVLVHNDLPVLSVDGDCGHRNGEDPADALSAPVLCVLFVFKFLQSCLPFLTQIGVD
jgi:hypothetical protein